MKKLKNGEIWQDVNGNDIQAHGGCIIEYEGAYYWYGEHKGQDNCPGTTRVDVIGVSCYKSANLVDWEYMGLALAADKDNSESYIHSSKVLERPKVVYNKKNNNFVMWIHVDSADYTLAAVGIAVSDKPEGPFELLEVKVPNRQDSRDMTVYVDEDDVAYLIHSKDWNNTMNIARLNDSYTDVDGYYVATMIDQQREAPALCKYNGWYYMVTSGCTGWEPNSALYSTCERMMGQWRLIDNPCEGENYRRTFNGQSTYIFKANNKFWLMLDHWLSNDLKKSGYSILPIEFDGGRMTVRWTYEWCGIE